MSNNCVVKGVSCKQCKCTFTSGNAVNVVKEDITCVYVKLFYVKNLCIKSTERLAVDAAYVFQIAKCCECKSKVGVYIRLTAKANGDVVNAVKFDLNAVNVDKDSDSDVTRGDVVVDKEKFYNEVELREDVVDAFRRRVEIAKGNVNECVERIKECMMCMNVLADKVPSIKEKLLGYVERICERDQNAIRNVVEFQQVEKEKEGNEGGKGKEEGEGGDIEGVGRMIPQRFGNGNNNNKVMKKKRNKSKI
jgi:hypothetical protein